MAPSLPYKFKPIIPRMKKHNRGRGVHAPRSKTEKASAKRLLVASEVKNWWNKRVDSGHLFEATSSTVEEGQDYLGSLPWPDFVSLTALHVEFQSDTGIGVARLSFCHMWHKASGIPRGKAKSVRIKTDDGVPLFEKGVTFYDVSSL